MTTVRNFRRILLVGSASLAVFACSDTNITSPGATTVAATPTPTPTPTATPTPVADFDRVPTAGCPTGTTKKTFTTTLGTTSACSINSPVVGVVTLVAESGKQIAYALEGKAEVGSDDAGVTVGTLKIDAGVSVFGSSASDYLVVNRGSKIEAVGTSTAPVVFTSATAVQSATSESSHTSAEWGGLVINGFAPINACDSSTAVGGTVQCTKAGEGSSGLFGGDRPTDNSGILKYVRVEYAGFKVNDADELNGIAFQGVGSGTEVDYVQVHKSADDAVEFFGGTVNAKHLVLTGSDDDGFDWTDGYSGKAQFVVVKQGPTSSEGDPRGFEGDNLDKNNDNLPRSNPSVSNFTIVSGPDFGKSVGSQSGMVIRRGTAGEFFNGVVAGFPHFGLDVDDSATYAGFTKDDSVGNEKLSIGSLIVEGSVSDLGTDSDDATLASLVTNISTVPTTLVSGVLPGPAEKAVVATDPTSLDSFFTAANYAGAFSSTETVDNNWTTGWTLAGTIFPAAAPASCPTGTTDASETISGKKVCTITGLISNDLRLANGDSLVYALSGKVQVGVDVKGDAANPDVGGKSVTLTVDPGVTVFGNTTSDYLVVNRGSKLEANGTEASPITFASRAYVAGTSTATSTAEWGGLVINGRAPINACDSATATGGAADCEKAGEGSSGLFGGNSATDNSGTLKYVRVLYAGFKVNDADELNGIAFQGVGNGTLVDYVQVVNSADDSIEFFGGTVNAKHLVLIGGDDDGFDWTDGYSGKSQYVIVQQGPTSSEGDPRGFEGDNLDKKNDNLPRSNPKVSNFTILGGPDFGKSLGNQSGMVIRRGTAGSFVNGVVAGFPHFGLDVDDSATYNRFAGDDAAGNEKLTIGSILLNATTSALATDSDDSTLSTNVSNISTAANTLTGTNPFFTGTSGLVPGSAEAGVITVDPTTLGAAFFEASNYAGAVKDVNDKWYLGWTVDAAGVATVK